MGQRLLLAWAVGVLSLVAACADGRPGMGEWRARWDAVQIALPPAEAFAARDRAAQLCKDALVIVREDARRLKPAPTEALDDLVHRWRNFAAEFYYECPSKSGPYAGFEVGLAHLAELDDEIRRLAIPTR